MTIRCRESLRAIFALVGAALWLLVSFFPLFGGAAKHAVLCRGRQFDGQFDECFNDYLPLFELAAPLLALALLWPMLRLAFTLWAPEPELRTRRWWLANRCPKRDDWPQLQLLSGAGAAWCLWRGALYPWDRLTAPYLITWGLFALWFGAAIWVSRPQSAAGQP